MNAKKTNSTQLSSKAKGNSIKPRNPLSLNPLMKKSHAHTKNNKTERSKEKQALKKKIQHLD